MRGLLRGLTFMLNIKTDKMEDKEKYKNLVQIIGDLLKVKGNEWLIAEVLRVVGQNHPIDKIADHPLINEIYEHCIKEVIKKQANDFYSKFPIEDKEVMGEIIYAFQEMEYNRRRDRFYEFSFNLNQQIEGIINYLFENKFKQKWSKVKDNEVLSNINNSLEPAILQDLVFPKYQNKEGEWARSEKWTDLAKFKLVYFLIIPHSPNNSDDKFFKVKQVIKEKKEITVARNEAHLGGESFEWQKEILAKIKGNESRYYLKFYGFLQDFVTKIESSYNPKDSQGPLQNLHKDTKRGQKKKEGKKYSKKKSGNSHHQKNNPFADLDLENKVKQKARENKENK